MSFNTWLAFFVASWLISLSPGPGAVASMTAGLRYRYGRAIWNIFGLQLGIILLVAIVGAGLGAILAASVVAFEAIRWVGVAYLILLGIEQWRAPAVPIEAHGEEGTSRMQLLLRGFLVNASNPKGIVFMLAVLPQFIQPSAPQWPQYAVCALTLLFTDMVVMSGYTLFAANVLGAMRDPKYIRRTNRLFGALFIGAGVMLAGFKRS